MCELWMIHEEDIDINFICLVVNLPPDLISLVTELCVLGMLFQREKLMFSLLIVLEQVDNSLLIYHCKLN